MTENKKGLRIAAGVILLAYMVLSLAILISSYFLNRMSRYGSFFSFYWAASLTDLLLAVTGVLILLRTFKPAAFVQCAKAVLCLVFFVMNILAIIKGKAVTTSIFSILINLTDLAIAALLFLGFLKSKSSSRTLFLIAAILAAVSSAFSVIPQIIYDIDYISSNITLIIGPLFAFLFAAIPLFLAWFFMSVYFRAQGESADLRGYPGYPPQGYAPSQGGGAYRPQQPGYPNYQGQPYYPQQNPYPASQPQPYAPQMQNSYPPYQGQTYAPQAGNAQPAQQPDNTRQG